VKESGEKDTWDGSKEQKREVEVYEVGNDLRS
jgi:hypothetical protein